MLESLKRISGAQNLSDDLNSHRATGPWVCKNCGWCGSVPAPGVPSQRFRGVCPWAYHKSDCQGAMVQHFGKRQVKCFFFDAAPIRSPTAERNRIARTSYRPGSAAAPERRYSSRDRVSRRHSRYAAEKPSSTYPACGMDSPSLPRKTTGGR